MISDAVGLERISRIVGYKIIKGNFATTSPNLPQRIALLGEANDANQGTLDTNPKQITSAQQAGDLYGYGSPIHMAARIMLPKQGGGIGGVPLIVYPQLKAGGATPKVLHLVATGTATDNGTHTIIVAGRSGVDGIFYDININAGDTPTVIHGKIDDAINNILGSPFIAVDLAYEVAFTSKWSGLTANDLSISVETNGNSLGITYSVINAGNGSGTPSVQASLDSFGADWNTIVVNTYGTVSNVMTTLETFNGIPDPVNPTGRFVGIVMKPFVALTGSTADDPTSITNTRLNNVTIAICPAPRSAGHPLEAAANMAVLFATMSQNNPHLDVMGLGYPDMPTPTSIGSMTDYNNRDSFVKKGCSTVTLEGGQYIVQDFVTTYHPTGEDPPQFRYCRNIMLDLNVRFAYYLLEQINVVSHTIAADQDTVNAANVIKPKQWIALVSQLASDLAKRALIVDAAFMQKSIKVGIGTSNPDRLETFFSYKRSGTVRIASTTAQAGFNFGTL